MFQVQTHQKINNCGNLHYSCKKILRNASLIAIPWNRGWTGGKNYFRQELLSRAFDGKTRLGLVCTAAGFLVLSPTLMWHYQTTHFQWNHWERVTCVLVLSKAVRCMTRATAWSDLYPFGLDVPRLAIVVGEHCDRCSSQAVVCELWLYNCSLWNLFHNVAERMCTKRCVAKPDFVVCGIELLALTISLLLKQSTWRWIEMPQVVLERFHGTSFRPRDGKYLRIRFILSIYEASLVICCSRQGSSLTSVQFVVCNSMWPFSWRKHCGCRLPLVFTSMSSKKKGRGRNKPSSVTGQDSNCRLGRVRRSQIVSSTALSRLESLSTDVFEPRTSTRSSCSGFQHVSMSDQRVTKLSFYLSQLEICNEKGAKRVEEEKIDVDVRGSKTAVLKLSIVFFFFLWTTPAMFPCFPSRIRFGADTFVFSRTIFRPLCIPDPSISSQTTQRFTA